MPTFNCSTCGYTPSPDVPYLDSPCATCRLASDYTNTKKASIFESAGSVEAAEEQENSALARIDKDLEHAGDDPQPQPELKELTPAALQLLKETMEKQLMISLSGIMVRLFKLAKSSPVMFELVIKKMQYPYMSYSLLGSSMNPPCSKQNVLYHLKHAVEVFPELEATLLTDTRFSGGRYALQTVANRVRQEYASKRMRGLLYGELDPQAQERSMKELNAILHAPFLISTEIFEFNPYIKDEEE